MMKVEIRKARHRDLEAVLHLLAEVEGHSPIPPTDAIRVYRKMWQYRDYSWYLAVHGTRVVGIFSLLIFPTLLHGGGYEGILHIVVSADQRGQEIGARMMAKAVQICTVAGCSRLMLGASIGEDVHEVCKSFEAARAPQLPPMVRQRGKSLTLAIPHAVRLSH